MINDLYQSILRPRFVNHIQESKINTLNVNWVRRVKGKTITLSTTKARLHSRFNHQSLTIPHPSLPLLPSTNQIWIVRTSLNKSLIITHEINGKTRLLRAVFFISYLWPMTFPPVLQPLVLYDSHTHTHRLAINETGSSHVWPHNNRKVIQFCSCSGRSADSRNPSIEHSPSSFWDFAHLSVPSSGVLAHIQSYSMIVMDMRGGE